MTDFTLVVGVDEYHLRQLIEVWPTWKRHKPSLLKHPMIVFCDRWQVAPGSVHFEIDHPDLRVVYWPEHPGIEYEGGDDKWTNLQRYKMLSGFVHVPAEHVETPYWLKLDTDVVATGCDDWIDPDWFSGHPGIVSHPWGFTKPADQMLKLDEWVGGSDPDHLMGLNKMPPLNLAPEEGSDRLRHKRIISWCGFFKTSMTSFAAALARKTCGEGKLPVPSQDGYLWYVATRLGLEVKRPNMKRRGWEHWSAMHNVVEASRRAVQC